jgi:hypothetical protein
VAESERHAFQPVSLVLGLVVMAVGLLFLVDQQGVDIDRAVTAAAVVAAVAAISVIRTVVRMLSPRRPD